MARPYSLDLRERVVAAVAVGESCRKVAATYKVSVASVVKWSQRFRTTGSVAAKRMGGNQPRSLAGERDWLLARLAAVPDLTLRALVMELVERGVVTSYGSVWRIVHDAGITFKKNSVRHRAGSPRRGANIPLHDEVKAFSSETAELRAQALRHETNLDWLAGIASFKAVLLEGLEVVFIVMAVGAGRGLVVPASAGALAACLLVAVAGFVLHRPLSRVPENTLKFAVGVMLSAFGIFWTSEGLGIAWPAADLAIIAIAALFLVAALAAVGFVRRTKAEVLS